MNNKHLFFIFIVFLLVFSCEESIEHHEEEYVFGFNIKKSESITVNSSYELNHDETVLTGFKKDELWIAIYNNNTKERVFEFTDKITNGKKHVLEKLYGEREIINLNHVSIHGAIVKNGSHVFLIGLQGNQGIGPTELIVISESDEIKRVYDNRYQGQQNRLVNWYEEFFITCSDARLTGFNNNELIVYNIKGNEIFRTTKYDDTGESIVNLIPVDHDKGLNIDNGFVFLRNIRTNETIWRFDYSSDLNERYRIDNRNVLDRGNYFEINIDVTYENGKMDNLTLKINKNTGMSID